MRRRGSSPRMRVTHIMLFGQAGIVGIIPAYAGNKRFIIHCPFRFRDHPRVCGEHRSGRVPTVKGAGSSPRMRGTPHQPTVQQNKPRIIPAYAGNTGFAETVQISLGDHPRVCGEHFYAVHVACTLMGSSPRMRGTHRLKRCGIIIIGIIPAYAGNTIAWWDCLWCPGDHPRVCGEHLRIAHVILGELGSSPRMRGTH